MYDGTSPSDQPGKTTSLQRARGRVRIEVRADGGTTRLSDLYQDGCAKVRLPRVYDGQGIDAVLLNTAGGLTGGDYYRTEAVAGEDASLTLTTQTCERLYRAVDGTARVETELRAEAGAALHWLPQPVPSWCKWPYVLRIPSWNCYIRYVVAASAQQATCHAFCCCCNHTRRRFSLTSCVFAVV